MSRRTYILVWDMFVWSGWAYLVFWRGASVWWVLLAIAITSMSAEEGRARVAQ